MYYLSNLQDSKLETINEHTTSQNKNIIIREIEDSEAKGNSKRYRIEISQLAVKELLETISPHLYMDAINFYKSWILNKDLIVNIRTMKQHIKNILILSLIDIAQISNNIFNKKDIKITIQPSTKRFSRFMFLFKDKALRQKVFYKDPAVFLTILRAGIEAEGNIDDLSFIMEDIKDIKERDDTAMLATIHKSISNCRFTIKKSSCINKSVHRDLLIQYLTICLNELSI